TPFRRLLTREDLPAREAEARRKVGSRSLPRPGLPGRQPLQHAAFRLARPPEEEPQQRHGPHDAGHERVHKALLTALDPQHFRRIHLREPRHFTRPFVENAVPARRPPGAGGGGRAGGNEPATALLGWTGSSSPRAVIELSSRSRAARSP